jgi:hypothetical protein
MTTRADLLQGLRLRLKDPDGRRWSDEELLAYLKATVDDYSRHFPRVREQQFTTDGVTRIYDLPADLLGEMVEEVAIVGETAGGYERLVPRRSLVYRGNRWYEIVGEKLHFGWVPAGNLTVRVRYNAVHDLPAVGDTTVPPEDEEIIYTGAMAMAWQRLAGNDAALSRWKEEGRRDDNPVIPMHVDLWARYRRLIDTKHGDLRAVRKLLRIRRRR